MLNRLHNLDRSQMERLHNSCMQILATQGIVFHEPEAILRRRATTLSRRMSGTLRTYSSTMGGDTRRVLAFGSSPQPSSDLRCSFIPNDRTVLDIVVVSPSF
jgi:hypothetical protein